MIIGPIIFGVSVYSPVKPTNLGLIGQKESKADLSLKYIYK